MFLKTTVQTRYEAAISESLRLIEEFDELRALGMPVDLDDLCIAIPNTYHGYGERNTMIDQDCRD